MKIASLRFCFSIATIGLLLIGCSKDKKLPATIPVTGVVTYKGEPLADANVMFVPVDPKGRSANGKTDANGKFVLKTYVGASHELTGALEGDYKIRALRQTKCAWYELGFSR